MTFALTSFFADGVKFNGPGMYRGTQRYGFTITGTTGDVDLDLGDTTGTFWTAATANSTYGTMASQVLSFITSNVSSLQTTSNIYCPELVDRIAVASSPTGVQYTISITSATKLPEITFGTGTGETAYTVFIDYLMEPNIQPQALSYNIG